MTGTMTRKDGGGTMGRAAVVEDLSDTSLSSLSDDRQAKRGSKAMPRESNAALDMDAYHTLRKDVVDDQKGESIIDMNVYNTMKGGAGGAGGNDRSAIDAAIFSALESESE